jgi:hypothetical protein
LSVFYSVFALLFFSFIPFFLFLFFYPRTGLGIDGAALGAEAHPPPMHDPAAAPVPVAAPVPAAAAVPAAAPMPAGPQRDLPVLRTTDTDRKQRLQKKKPDAVKTKERELQLLQTVREKEAKAVGKLRKLLGTLLRSNSASSAAIQAGEYLHFLADLQVDDNDDDSDDDDFDPSTDEDSDEEPITAAPTDRPKRHADAEPITLDRPQFFRGGAANDTINHLKSPVPYSKLKGGKAVEAPVGLDDSLYEDVPESEYVPLLDRILAEAWDEKSIAFLLNLLSLLDSSLSAAFKEAVVSFFCVCTTFYFVLRVFSACLCWCGVVLASPGAVRCGVIGVVWCGAGIAWCGVV